MHLWETSVRTVEIVSGYIENASKGTHLKESKLIRRFGWPYNHSPHIADIDVVAGDSQRLPGDEPGFVCKTHMERKTYTNHHAFESPIFPASTLEVLSPPV